MAEKAAKKPNIFKRIGRGIVRFFKDTRGEMKKVVWPSRKQVRNNLIVVLVFVALCAVLIFLLDLAFGNLLKLMLEQSAKLGEKLVEDGGSSSSVAQSALAAVRPFISFISGR